MEGEDDADHVGTTNTLPHKGSYQGIGFSRAVFTHYPIVCTSTDSTAGRSRTIGVPAIAGIGRRVHLAAGGAEIDAALIERVDRHRVAQHVHVAVLLRQAFGERLPLVAAGAAAVDAQLAVGRIVLGVALDGNDVDGFRLVRVNVDDEAEVGRQVAADFVPVVAGVVACASRPSASA